MAFSRDKTNERSVRQITDARQTEDSSSICNLQIEADLAATESAIARATAIIVPPTTVWYPTLTPACVSGGRLAKELRIIVVSL